MDNTSAASFAASAKMPQNFASVVTTSVELTPQQAVDVGRYQQCIEAIGNATHDRKRRLAGLVVCVVLLTICLSQMQMYLSMNPFVSNIWTPEVGVLAGFESMVTLLQDTKVVAKLSNVEIQMVAQAVQLLLAKNCVTVFLAIHKLLIVTPVYVGCFFIAGKVWCWFWEAHDCLVAARRSLHEIKSSCRLLWGYEFVGRMVALFGN